MAGIYEREIAQLCENTSDALLLNQVKQGAVVLECGSGTGYMTRYMKEHLDASVYVVEYNVQAFEKAIRFATGGVCADLQSLDWGEAFSGIAFDYIIFADVLEHLKNPEAVLKYAASFLKNDGVILISLPNVAHNDIVLNLYHNRWNYTELGLLDNTHVHFWGKENLTELCLKTGLVPEILDYTIIPPFRTEQALTESEQSDMDLVDLVCRRKYGDIYQFVVTLRKNAYASEHSLSCIDRYEERHNAYGELPVCCAQYEAERKKLSDEREKECAELKEKNEKLETLIEVKIETILEQLKQQEIMQEDLKQFEKRLCETERKNASVEEMVQKELLETADINFMLSKQLRDTDDIIYMLKNLSRTSEDMRYVVQSSRWYRKIMEKIKHSLRLDRIFASYRTYGLFGSCKLACKKVLKIIYRKSSGNTILYSFEKKIFHIIKKCLPKFGERMDRIISEEKVMERRKKVFAEADVEAEFCWSGEKRRNFIEKPLVSVIVPNYNHAQYLRERLDSIYGQTYSNFEVILLDDCSTDNSREILMEYAKRFPENTVVDFNEVNGGKVFKQWNKGINHAKGKLIWIAESDDWCELDFLEKMVPQFEYESVMLAFCKSIFMQDGKQTWTLEEYLSDLPKLSFEKPFMISAHTAVHFGFGIKNMIPNVSSAMFRNTGEISKEITDIWQNIKLCGDWLFYLHTMIGGCLSYTNETTNYYRVHKNSTSLKIQKSPEYYREQELISIYVASHYAVDYSIFEQVQHNLEEHCKAIQQTDDVSVVSENYHLDIIKEAAKNRKPNVLMCGYAMQLGGGETYPIVLANEMKKQGIAVTFLNFDMEPYTDVVRNRLNADVPLVTLENTDVVGKVLQSLGGEVVHSHHASVDNILSVWLEAMADFSCKQIVTVHGMYETMDFENCKRCLKQLEKTCNRIIYIAEKNYKCFEECGFQDKFKMVKIGNGLPQMTVSPIERAELDIPEEAFVFCLVSRALREKGWLEAAEAVVQANEESAREIHLILVGEGEMRSEVTALNSRFIHAVGQKTNVRDYFATADMGILPSYYRGESYPLVLIECMLSGKPMLATDLGEVRHQMEDADGKLAGILLPIVDWKLDVAELRRQILRISNDRELYQVLCTRLPSATEKFDIAAIARQHLEIYKRGEM